MIGMFIPLVSLLFKLVAPKELRNYYSLEWQALARNPEALRQQQAEELMEKMEVRATPQYVRPNTEEDFGEEEDYEDERDAQFSSPGQPSRGRSPPPRRARNFDEIRKRMLCHNCGEPGHFAK